MSVGLDLLLSTLAASVAALGFAIIFQVPPRLLWRAALTGAAGYFVRALMHDAGNLSLPAATLAAAVVVGGTASVFARKTGAPASAFSAPGVIPLVPGATAFRAILTLFVLAQERGPRSTDAIVEGMTLGTQATFTLFAIVLGLALPSLVFRRPEAADVQ
jgi:uncharacterized membrane protein YjjB (DUF3815 family)